jgi:hypothetical protein
MRDHRQVDVATGVRYQGMKSTQLAPDKRLIMLRAVFRLNGPIFAMPIAGDQINALVANGQVDLSAHDGWNLPQQPDIGQRRAIYRLVLKVELNEPLKVATLLIVGTLAHPSIEVVPGRARSDETIRFHFLSG